MTLVNVAVAGGLQIINGFFVGSNHYMDVSKNRCTPKSSILIGFSIINHLFWGTLIFGNIHIMIILGLFCRATNARKYQLPLLGLNSHDISI